VALKAQFLDHLLGIFGGGVEILGLHLSRKFLL
jgi:hypothetical protein